MSYIMFLNLEESSITEHGELVTEQAAELGIHEPVCIYIQAVRVIYRAFMQCVFFVMIFGYPERRTYLVFVPFGIAPPFSVFRKPKRPQLVKSRSVRPDRIIIPSNSNNDCVPDFFHLLTIKALTDRPILGKYTPSPILQLTDAYDFPIHLDSARFQIRRRKGPEIIMRLSQRGEWLTRSRRWFGKWCAGEGQVL
ncbi:hypothetical protein D9613_010295 [Agrocybe pediades]|uniref:Uncharacterized protein n=1 Tax=Agrocybe pediades TaxID=84607 RepID=A0A8H4QFK1_9AGAR|nr:hypothetical protein D9613_010295 [Agrocybe pediades]